MIRKIIFTIFIFTLFGCTLTSESKPSKNVIVTTYTILNDVVKNLAPEDVEVKSLISVGLDPHSYTPTPSDISLLSSAEIIFALGLDLEASMSSLLDSISKTKSLYKVGDDLDPALLITSKDNENIYDPHVWFDLDIWNLVALNVKNNLISEFPNQSQEIELNYLAYKKSLDDLSSYANSILANLPVEKRFLITAHDAFSYFAKKYEFKLHTLQGISTKSDYSIKDINDIVDLVIENQIPAIFTESSVSNKSIFTIIEKVKDRNFSVSVGGELFSDSLGHIGSEFESFEAVFKHNLETIVNNLK